MSENKPKHVVDWRDSLEHSSVVLGLEIIPLQINFLSYIPTGRDKGDLSQVNDVTTGVHWLSIEDQKQLNRTQCWTFELSTLNDSGSYESTAD